MGFFDFFKKPPRIHDPLFGELRYEGGFASCNVPFAPLNKQVEVLITCGPEGPIQAQSDFFARVEQDYAALIPGCARVIEEEFRNWKEEFVIRDFAKEFELVCIEVPDNTAGEWSLSFTSSHDLDHHFTVSLLDNNATHVLIDG